MRYCIVLSDTPALAVGRRNSVLLIGKALLDVLSDGWQLTEALPADWIENQK
jgi:hypothetical protein